MDGLASELLVWSRKPLRALVMDLVRFGPDEAAGALVAKPLKFELLRDNGFGHRRHGGWINMSAQTVEPWLRGTRSDVDAVRRGVVHALELAAEDIAKWCGDLSDKEMESRPLGLPSVGFHLRHMARSLDRLLTYAEGQQLSELQMKALKTEMENGAGREATLMEFAEGIEMAVAQIVKIAPDSYEEKRGVGRKMLPTTVGGLLVHCADHTQRHVGQAVTTAKAVMEMRPKI